MDKDQENQHLLRQTLWLILAAMFYTVCFNVVYIYVLANRYEYFSFHPVLLEDLLIFGCVAILPVIFMPRMLKKPSSIIIWLLYILVFIPSCIIPLFALNINRPYLFSNLLIMIICFMILNVVRMLKTIHFPAIRINEKIIWFLFECLVSLVLIAVFVKYRKIMHLSSISTVYEQRKIAARAIVSRSIFAYLIFWLESVICPFLIVCGVFLKKYIALLIGICGQLMVYSIFAGKGTLFSIVFLIAMLLFFKIKKNKLSLTAFFYYIIIFIGLSVLVDHLIFHHGFMVGHFVRRVLYIPGLLTGWYFVFFQHYSHYFLSKSILRSFIVSPYSVVIPHQVSYFITGRTGIDANANYFASAYANFGRFGMLIYSFILMLILWVLDGLSSKWPKPIIYTLAFFISFSLINTDLLVFLCTHGVIILFFLLYLLVPQKLNKRTKEVKISYQKNGDKV